MALTKVADSARTREAIAELATGANATATNDNAVAGTIGEFSSSLVAVGSPVSLTTATAANITSLSLTAGDWVCYGSINFAGASATVTARQGSINTTSATQKTDGSEVNNEVATTTATQKHAISIPGIRVSIASTTTVYLVATATFSAGTVTGYGRLAARRVR